MEIFFDGGKFGTPVKKRSRSISTINREVTDRSALISMNTYLRALSNADAFSKLESKGTATTGHSFSTSTPTHSQPVCCLVFLLLPGIGYRSSGS